MDMKSESIQSPNLKKVIENSELEEANGNSLTEPLLGEKAAENTESDNKLPSEVKYVLLMAFNTNLAYWQLAPFFPTFIKNKNINKIWVGIAMSCFAMMFLLSSLFNGRVMLNYMKRINGCFIG